MENKYLWKTLVCSLLLSSLLMNEVGAGTTRGKEKRAVIEISSEEEKNEEAKALEKPRIDYTNTTEREKLYTQQELTEESKAAIAEFETFVEEQKKHPYIKSNQTEVEYKRKKVNQLLMKLSGVPEEVALIEDITVDAENDNYKIPVRQYRANTKKPTKELILFVHGGGWTHGSFDTYDYFCKKLVRTTNRDVATLEQRLSPEHSCPIPLNDVISVYIHYYSSKYRHIILCGDSSGASLIITLCIKAFERGIDRPHALVLLYPVLSNDFESRSFKTFGNCVALSEKAIAKYVSNYAGRPYNSANAQSNKFVYPNLEENMNVYPKLMLISAGYDALLDGQLDFIGKFKKSEREDYVHILDEGAIHGYMTYGRYFDALITENCKKIRDFLDGKLR